MAAAALHVALPLLAADPLVYMSILASRKHRLNASDNPVVGLFVSGDRGLTWNHLGWREYIRTFYAEAGSDGTIWLACGNGVLRSSDGGRTCAITTGWEITEVLKVRVAPDNPNVIMGATAYGIVRSTDGGSTWRALTNGFRRTFTSDVIIDYSVPERILAAGEAGVLLSTNGGESWRPTDIGTTSNVLLQNPLRPAEFWAGTEENGVHQSTDGGKRWYRRGAQFSGVPVYALAIDPASSGRIFAGTYGRGVFRSDDGGATWKERNIGLENRDVHSLCVVPGTPTVLLAGTMNGGLYRSTDGGDRWSFAGSEDAQVWGLSVSPPLQRGNR